MENSSSDPPVHLVFSALWNELRETIGTAPTATLLHRAIVLSRDTCPLMDRITIERNEREYRYNIPLEVDYDSETTENLGEFVDCVLTLLSKLTGKVLVQQLLQDPLIRHLAGKE